MKHWYLNGDHFCRGEISRPFKCSLHLRCSSDPSCRLKRLPTTFDVSQQMTQSRVKVGQGRRSGRDHLEQLHSDSHVSVDASLLEEPVESWPGTAVRTRPSWTISQRQPRFSRRKFAGGASWKFFLEICGQNFNKKKSKMWFEHVLSDTFDI